MKKLERGRAYNREIQEVYVMNVNPVLDPRMPVGQESEKTRRKDINLP